MTSFEYTPLQINTACIVHVNVGGHWCPLAVFIDTDDVDALDLAKEYIENSKKYSINEFKTQLVPLIQVI